MIQGWSKNLMLKICYFSSFTIYLELTLVVTKMKDSRLAYLRTLRAQKFHGHICPSASAFYHWQGYCLQNKITKKTSIKQDIGNSRFFKYLIPLDAKKISLHRAHHGCLNRANDLVQRVKRDRKGLARLLLSSCLKQRFLFLASVCLNDSIQCPSIQ